MNYIKLADTLISIKSGKKGDKIRLIICKTHIKVMTLFITRYKQARTKKQLWNILILNWGKIECHLISAIP